MSDPWPKWLSPAEQAECDRIVRVFTDWAWGHGDKCAECFGQTCPTLQKGIDRAQQLLTEITEPAWVRHLQQLEATYSHEKFWKGTQ